MKSTRLNQVMPKLMAGIIIVAVSVALMRAGLRKEKAEPQLQSPLPRAERSRGLPLNQPPTIAVAAASHLADDDLVVGVVTPQGARAYPWWVMTNHQIVNDTWAGIPLVVTLCPISSGVSAFVAQVDDLKDETTLSFRHCGVAVGTFEMCDDQTSSRWHPQRGMAQEGRLSGYNLSRLFTLTVDWATWKRLFPQSDVVLSARSLVDPRYLQDQRGQWGNSELPTQYQPIGEVDPRLPPNSLVMGLLPSPQHSELALSLAAVGTSLQVISIQDSALLLVPLGGQLVRAFWIADLPREGWQWDEKALQVVNGENRWNLLGEPHAAQSRLEVAEGYLTEWFSWVSSWPETELYPPPTTEGK